MGITKKILVAADSPAIQKIASSILAGENVQIVTVANGIAAIKKYVLENPQVVLADIEMPGKDGYEVCDYIKKTPGTDQTMVLLVVGEMEHYDENRAKEAKADGVVKKPFNVRELFDLVHGHLEKISQAEAAEAPPEPAASSAASSSLPDAAPAEAADPEPEPDLEPPKPPELDFSNLKEPMALGEIPMDYPEESPAPEPAPGAAPEEKKAPIFDLAAAAILGAVAAKPKAPVPAQKDSKPDSKPAEPAGKAKTPAAAPAVDASMIQAVVEKAITSSSTEKGAFDAKAVHTTVENALEALLAPKVAKEVAERITSELAKQL